MAASYKTIEEIFEVIKRNVDYETAKTIINDLSKIKGNKSFKDTIKRLKEKMTKESKEEYKQSLFYPDI